MKSDQILNVTSPDLLRGKYFVIDSLPPLPPPICNQCVSLRPLAAEKANQLKPNSTGIYPLSDFAGKYWYAYFGRGALADWPLPVPSDWEPASCLAALGFAALSTEDLAIVLERGFGAGVYQGPFDRRGQASYALDVAWEAPD